ncbi:rCG61561 [Rattus norvegicus]|uniref:RCG61561 n=1 Tax=Rattus norvegicus TaxID=10116 RepID=A6H9Q4_RAT|nr:rCG61561 [Rattus norvegicus]
MAVIFLALLR